MYSLWSRPARCARGGQRSPGGAQAPDELRRPATTKPAARRPSTRAMIERTIEAVSLSLFGFTTAAAGAVEPGVAAAALAPLSDSSGALPEASRYTSPFAVWGCLMNGVSFPVVRFTTSTSLPTVSLEA